MATIILSIFKENLVYAIMALDVYVTYRILDFPDLLMGGTFPLGAVFITTGIARGFVHPVVALPLSFLLETMADCITGLIYAKLKVWDLLSRIIVMIVLCSVSLRVVGRSNLPIFNKDTIFSNPWLERAILRVLKPYTTTIILLAIILIYRLLLDAHLKTRSGCPLRTMGDNDLLVTSLAKGKGMVKITGLAITNGFVALAGSMYCQQKGFLEISTEASTVVAGLANVIIGIQLFKRFGFIESITAIAIGSIIYKACVPLALSLGDSRLTLGSITVSFPVMTLDLKLITSILFFIILMTDSPRGKRIKSHTRAGAHQ